MSPIPIAWSRRCLVALTFVIAPSVARAQSIQVTSGYLDIGGSAGATGRAVLGGDRGFSMAAGVSASGGNYQPGNCDADPLHCVPGATVNLFAFWSGLDVIFGRSPLTLDGTTYWDVNGATSANYVNLEFSGSATLPPIAPSATVTASFTFTGPLAHQVGSTVVYETMTGTGTATLFLTADAYFPGSWHLDRIQYVLGSTLPFPWRSADVGLVGRQGSASESSEAFTIAGAGSDIWGTADSFNYTSQPLVGDGEVVARVTTEQDTNQYAKAGVMIRATYDTSSPFVLLDLKPGGGVELLSRSTAGDSASFVEGASSTFPGWLKLSRSGATVTASVSADGSVWNAVGSATLGGPASAGLAVTSHDTGTLNQATFDHASVTAAGALPAPWNHLDIGLVGATGFASFSAGTFVAGGGGADIWGAADAFQYVYRNVLGDTQITARVVSEQGTSTYAKAGVMLRQSLASDAAHVILDIRPGGQIEFMTRSVAGASTTFVAGASASFPVWLRLTRIATTVTGAISNDGTSWTTVGTTTLNTSSYAGLAVTSHDSSQVNTATFDNVAVGATSPPPGGSPSNVVIYAGDVPSANLHGAWSRVADSTGASGSALTAPDAGVSLTSAPLASPTDYVDIAFFAEAGTPYTLWLRLKASNNSKFNDSVWAQFSDALASGSPAYAIGSSNGLLVNLATDATASSLSGWGWQNSAYWLTQTTTVSFASSGTHTLRLQTREDGARIDQVVLSPTTYLTTPPGPVSNDTTIVPKP